MTEETFGPHRLQAVVGRVGLGEACDDGFVEQTGAVGAPGRRPARRVARAPHVRGVVLRGQRTRHRDPGFRRDRRATGAVARHVPPASGPEYLVRKGDQLYVRCYDTDYVSALDGST